MAKEAMDRAIAASATWRGAPPQGAFTEQGPQAHQGGPHEGGQAPTLAHHGAAHPCSRQEREAIWLEGYEAARSVVRHFFREERAMESPRAPGKETRLTEVAREEHGPGPSHGRRTERASGSSDRHGARKVRTNPRIKAEPAPMEVDQEGAENQDQGDVHGTDQENLDFADQQHYADILEGGWNHEVVDLTQAKEGPVIDLEVQLDVREEMLSLRLRIYQDTTEASRRDDVRKEYRLYGLLDRIQEVLKTAAAMHPPFHGEVEGYGTEAIRDSNNRRSRMHI
eukprot:10246655-Heterocapsa_arctica.AAC.1